MADDRLAADRELDPGRVAPDGRAVSRSTRACGRGARRAAGVHMSARVATIRRLLLAGAADHDRDRRWTGSGAAEVAECVAAAGRRRDGLAREQRAHRRDDSSSQSSRWPGRSPNSIPCASCSSSCHAAPRPAMTRPPLAWSIVVSDFATTPRVPEGVRADEQPEPGARSSPSPRRRAWRSPRRRACTGRRDRVQVVPRPDVLVAELVDENAAASNSDQVAACLNRQIPSRTSVIGWRTARAPGRWATGPL